MKIRQCNVLGLARSIQLVDWIKERLESLQKNKTTKEAIASSASEILGFKVTPHNVSYAAQAAGLTWVKPKTKKASAKTVSRVLAKAIVELAEKAGVELSDSRIYDICGGQRMRQPAEVVATAQPQVLPSTITVDQAVMS